MNCVQNPESCGGTGGCSGATPELAFNYTVSSGLPLEADLPYRGSDGKCTAVKPAVTVDGYKTAISNDAESVATLLATVGPASIAAAAGPWQFYGGGVFEGCSKSIFGKPDATLDHAIQLVGYGVDSQHGGYWLVRNSWGSGWGEQGYIRITRKNDNQTFIDARPADGIACKPYPAQQVVGGECGVLFDVVYPTGAKAAGTTIVV